MKNLDVGALQAVFEVLQQHYPERLGELWFLNAPFIFWGLWRVVSPFIQQATKEKIKFLSGRDRERMLQQYIPQDVSILLLKPGVSLPFYRVAAHWSCKRQTVCLLVEVLHIGVSYYSGSLQLCAYDTCKHSTCQGETQPPLHLGSLLQLEIVDTMLCTVQAATSAGHRCRCCPKRMEVKQP